MERVAKGTYSFDFDEWKGVSIEAKQFIKKMLEYDPTKRYTAEQSMNDAWIKKYTSKNVVDAPLMQNALKNMTNFRVKRKNEKIEIFEIIEKIEIFEIIEKNEKIEILEKIEKIEIFEIIEKILKKMKKS